MLIQNLHKAKEYKEETLHLAGSIADRYLASLSLKNQEVPDSVTLATICLLLAAKLEQPMSPSFQRMVNLLPEETRAAVTKQRLVAMEESIIKELNFQMHYAGPIPYLCRFQRIFNVDLEKGDTGAKQVGFAARQFCRFMMRKPEFLKFKASQQAAAAFVLALNLATSAYAQKLGLAPLTPEHYNHIDYQRDPHNPLRLWSTSVAQLVSVNQSDFLPVYKILSVYVNELFFKGQLVQDPTLWFADDLHSVKTSVLSPAKVQSPSTCNSTPVKNELC